MSEQGYKGYAVNMEDIKRANARAGHHFFEASSMRFFASRVGQTVYGGRYFVTSEQFRDYASGRVDARRYTIRECDHEGHVRTVGDFQGFGTAAQARSAIKLILGMGESS
jgi:hypothetical protein